MRHKVAALGISLLSILAPDRSDRSGHGRGGRGRAGPGELDGATLLGAAGGTERHRVRTDGARAIGVDAAAVRGIGPMPPGGHAGWPCRAARGRLPAFSNYAQLYADGRVRHSGRRQGDLSQRDRDEPDRSGVPRVVGQGRAGAGGVDAKLSRGADDRERRGGAAERGRVALGRAGRFGRRRDSRHERLLHRAQRGDEPEHADRSPDIVGGQQRDDHAGFGKLDDRVDGSDRPDRPPGSDRRRRSDGSHRPAGRDRFRRRDGPPRRDWHRGFPGSDRCPGSDRSDGRAGSGGYQRHERSRRRDGSHRCDRCDRGQGASVAAGLECGNDLRRRRGGVIQRGELHQPCGGQYGKPA